MKKYLLLALLAFTTCITFGNTTGSKPTLEWDRPLHKEIRVFSPAIEVYSISIYDATHISIRTDAYPTDPTYTWRVQISCSATAYYRSGPGFGTWGWYPITWLWNADTPPNTGLHDTYITLNYPTQFNKISCGDCDGGYEVDWNDYYVYNTYHL